MVFKKNKKVFIFILYFLFSAFVLRGILFSSGIIVGNDWGGLPATKTEIGITFSEYQYAWLNSGNALGTLNFSQNSMLTFGLMRLFSIFGIDGIMFVKIFILFVFTIAGFSLFLLLKYFTVSNKVSFIGGLIYITTPLFFNYTIMGWTYVLLFMSILPLGVKYFIKANKESGWGNIIAVSLIFEIMLLQSQAAIWFPMILFALSIYLVSNKKTLLVYLKNFFSLFFLTFFLNLWWGITILLVRSEVIYGNDILMSSESLGASAMSFPLNMLRLYGSLFNFQYEYILEKSGWIVLSFLLPILLLFSFFLKNKRRLKISFLVIFFIPVLFYCLDSKRELLLSIPFINVIRDFSRFAVLSTFAATIMGSFFLEYLYRNKAGYRRLLFYVAVILFLVSIFPWYGNYITKYESGLAKHQRIRTKEFPQEYFNLNYFLSQNRVESKGVYLPSSIIIELSDDGRFNGRYQGFYDIFAAHSVLHGWYPSNSRNSGYGDRFVKKILSANRYADFMKLSNVSVIIIRKDMIMDNLVGVIGSLDRDENFSKFFDSEKILAYKRKATNFLPHFYTSQKSIISQRNINNLSNIVSSSDWQTRSIIFLWEQNSNKENALDKLKNNNNQSSSEAGGDNCAEEGGVALPTLEFKKINPTKYRVRVHGASGVFPLVFSESFHDGWKSYLVKQGVDSLPTYLPDRQAGRQAATHSNDTLGDYKILDGNVEDQATRDELQNYIDSGFVTTLGDGKEKTIKHKKWENNQEKLDYVEKYQIDFVSKNFQGTIQNDNLPNGNIFETWLKKPIENNANHLMANGYANSWVVDTNEICQSNSKLKNQISNIKIGDQDSSGNCIQNPDGSYDFEMIVEFWPQRLFYVGLAISGLTLLGCVGYLGYDWRKRKKLDPKIG